MTKYSAAGFGQRLLDFHIQELKTAIDSPDEESFRAIIGLLEDGQLDIDDTCMSDLFCNNFGLTNELLQQWADPNCFTPSEEKARAYYLQFIHYELENYRQTMSK